MAGILYHRFTLICLGVVIALSVNHADANLTINLTFGVGFDGPDSVVQRRLVRAAADYWEAVIVTDYTVEITANRVDLSLIGPGVHGRMHSNSQTESPHPATMTHLPLSAVVEMSTNLVNDFYFDVTPYDSDEYSLDDRGVGFAKPGTGAVNRIDALTVWIHELGHALGYVGANGQHADGMPTTGYTDYANNLSGLNYQFDWLVDGSEGNMGDIVALFNINHIAFQGPNSWIANMNPFSTFGLRKLITPIDIDIIGDAFRLNIDELARPQLGDINCDGLVNLLDVQPFVDLLLANGYSSKADINEDGVIDLLDVGPFVEILNDS